MSKVILGDYFKCVGGSYSNPLSKNTDSFLHAESGASIIVGNYVGMSSTCIWAKQRIEIGNHVNIGANSVLIDNDAHPMDYFARRRTIANNDIASSPIKIEDDVMIGTSVIILKGVTIGARSVIGAGSVVTKNIPSDCIAAGNPCKVIKVLNNTNTDE